MISEINYYYEKDFYWEILDKNDEKEQNSILFKNSYIKHLQGKEIVKKYLI